MKCITLALTLLAAPAFAQNADEAAVAAMTKAIEDAGCIVTAENGDAVLNAAGLDDAETMDVIADLYGNGLIALLEDGTMKLTNEVCE